MTEAWTPPAVKLRSHLAEDVMRHALELAFWHLADRWRAHLFHWPRHAFDFTAFAPEVPGLMGGQERRFFNAMVDLAAHHQPQDQT